MIYDDDVKLLSDNDTEMVAQIKVDKKQFKELMESIERIDYKRSLRAELEEIKRELNELISCDKFDDIGILDNHIKELQQ